MPPCKWVLSYFSVCLYEQEAWLRIYLHHKLCKFMVGNIKHFGFLKERCQAHSKEMFAHDRARRLHCQLKKTLARAVAYNAEVSIGLVRSLDIIACPSRGGYQNSQAAIIKDLNGII
mmetsp:Transcript_28666/g.58593  ORF Transcript_28666/g.58593 Transcript_28666/m.58593 type:complete len:117 (+) Transcript_28666:322-672(+)